MCWNGSATVGEFGGTLASIFQLSSQARFKWEGWKTVRKHSVARYSYVVEPPHSDYRLTSGVRGVMQSAIVGFHGEVEIDRETGAVVHFTYKADQIPRELWIDFALTTVDYDLADVGGRDYWLPARSETETTGRQIGLRNEVEFRDYRKFTSDTTVSFGAGR